MIKDTILGVDLGWVLQLESIGYHWVDMEHHEVDPIKAAKDMGANTVRLRVFVNPPEYGFWIKPAIEVKGHEMESCLVMLGFCDLESVVSVARRVKAQDMKLMIDFHYSDHFADPVFQDTPEEWKSLSLTELKGKLVEHTESVLKALVKEGISPSYVQVGNEINRGLLFPTGNRENHPEEMVELLNAGYDAVKRVCAEAKVITHLSAGQLLEMVQDFFDVFFQYGGKTDVIGLSYYPAWFQERHKPEEFLEVLNVIYKTYHKPIVICEIGGIDDEEEETYHLLADTLALTNKVENQALKGVVYWEPEISKEIMPDGYHLGAARLVDKKTLQYTNALKAYKDFEEV